MKLWIQSVQLSEAKTLLEGALLAIRNEVVSITTPKVDEQMVAKAARWLSSILKLIKLLSLDAQKKEFSYNLANSQMVLFQQELEELEYLHMQLAAKKEITYQ